MANGMTRWEEKYNELRGRMAGLRGRMNEEAKEVQALAVEGAAAFVFGSMEADARASGVQMATIGDLPPPLAWGAGAYIAGRMVEGRGGEILQAAGRGILVGYAYRKGYEGNT